MDMLKSMLDKLYSSQNGMMYFYIISAIIAFILIILIIVTIVKGNKVEEVKEDSKEKSQNLEELKVEDLNNDGVNNEENNISPIEDVKVDDINQELNNIEDKTNVVDSTIEETDDDLDLPRVKEEIDENKEEIPKLTNDVLTERLNALKNRD